MNRGTDVPEELMRPDRSQHPPPWPRPFAYTMDAKGVHVGAISEVWWIDRDGEGRFTEISWGFRFARLPAWVVKRLAER
jgi:hypothetical protein